MTRVTSLWDDISATEVRLGTLALWWLYQAGLIVKSPGGTVLAVDPYLSDAVQRSYNLGRKVSAPLDPAQVELDALLATHSHEDHLDPDSILTLLRRAESRFIGPPMAVDKVLAAGIPEVRTTPVRRGDEVRVGDLTVRAVHARHLFGLEPTPDAVGYVVSCGNVSLYHSGDTEYDSEIIVDTKGVVASFISINGTTGNMNAHEAAMLAWQQGASLAVPFHYGLWRDADYGTGATLDPETFVSTYRRLSPDGSTLILKPACAVVLCGTGLVSH